MERGQQKQSVNTPLIQVREAKGPENGKERSKILVEIQKQLWRAGPLVSVILLVHCLQTISLMFVGHLGQLSLSGASMATLFASVIGFTLLLFVSFEYMGLSSVLETLTGQAYGEKQYHMLGIHMHRAMFVLLLVSIPLAIIWANTRSILTLVGHNASIAAEAGQMLDLEIEVAMASSISYWINVLLLDLYVKFSSSCAKSWTGFSKESLQNIPISLKLAIPSAVMVCTRVSNVLGAGHPEAARLAGYAFSNEVEVVKYVAIMMPILAISDFLDGFQCVLSGNARGYGWQKIGAYVNLGSYYLAGITLVVLLDFAFHIGGKVHF
ncbi:hypothetical protein FEM48_Zijuj05G0096900 [Ziziphus jujuba var. spinosa]|uniref:Protein DETOXIFICATION 16-like n=1 Tax=Ziziphus jujuba var. spinosa TaxID=714518 RepID=A0A978VE83_ZIZJJ|nr:hypothetical protein FEM48_Zijuj05G0096900 [Ziziphus jujuba var. spinosa]